MAMALIDESILQPFGDDHERLARFWRWCPARTAANEREQTKTTRSSEENHDPYKVE
jgi:hypothetical protein